MSRKSTSSFLKDEVELLVQHFGIDRVRAALAKVPDMPVNGSEGQQRRPTNKPNQPVQPTVTSTLEQLRESDPEKHLLLTEFYARLKEKEVLPESHDIRHFTHLIGLKEIRGKSRKDLVPRLMRFLIEQPTERLEAHIKIAANVSEQQRQQGFSVLTDKLMGDQ